LYSAEASLIIAVMVSRNTAGDSSVQREAESLIRTKLETTIGLEPGGLSESAKEYLGRIKLDGFRDGPRPICVEIWAHQGKAKPAQQAKIMKDMCKLLLVEAKLKKACRKLFVVSDQAAVAHLSSSWQGEFADAFGIDILVVDIPEPTRTLIREAQKKQYR
jgi:hypothetical protein